MSRMGKLSTIKKEKKTVLTRLLSRLLSLTVWRDTVIYTTRYVNFNRKIKSHIMFLHLGNSEAIYDPAMGKYIVISHVGFGVK